MQYSINYNQGQVQIKITAKFTNLNTGTQVDDKENKQKLKHFLVLLNTMLSFRKNTDFTKI